MITQRNNLATFEGVKILAYCYDLGRNLLIECLLFIDFLL